MVAQLAERRGIPVEHARALLADVDLSADPPAEPAAAAPVEVQTAREEAAPAQAADPTADEHGAPPAPPQAATPARPEHAQRPSEEQADEPATEQEPAYEELVAADQPSAAAEARAVVENGVRAIAGEVRNSLDFHRSQEGGADVTRVVLSGSALELAGFAEALHSSLGVDVHAGTVDVVDTTQLHGVSAQRLAVATGLAAAEARQ
jgi:hypothetical protein